MIWRRNNFLLALLLCSLALWCEVSAGSSYLSPSQKPQSRMKTSRVGRQIMAVPDQPTEENHVMISAPFELGISMGEKEFEDYGTVLQEIVERLLGNAETKGRPSPL